MYQMQNWCMNSQEEDLYIYNNVLLTIKVWCMYTGKVHTMSNNEIFTYMCKHLIVWNVYPTLQSFGQLQEVNVTKK